MSLRYEKHGNIAHFIIDSGPMNVLYPEFHKEFFHRLKEFEIDPEIKVGLFYGADGKCFSVGDDLKSMHKPPRTKQEELAAYLFLHQNEGEKPMRPGWEHDVCAHRRYKPIVSAIESYCLGIAFSFALYHSDIRVAAENVKFGLTGIKFGAGGSSGPKRLAHGSWPEVSSAAQQAARAGLSHIVVLSDLSGETRDFEAGHASPPQKPARGRPKLGVTAREVTLLPRHWDWLAQQPGGASAALRRLVEAARKTSEADPRAAQAASSCRSTKGRMPPCW